MYGIYLLQAGDTSQDARRRATRFDVGRAFRMHDLPFDYDGKSEEAFAVLIEAGAPRLVTVVMLTINDLILLPGNTVELKPPTMIGDDKVFCMEIDGHEFDLVVFKYGIEF